jgi:hypothetical protein
MQAGTMRLTPGLAGFRRRGNRNNKVGLRPGLAGERQACRGFFPGQRVIEVIAAVVLAGFDPAFAGAADAVATVERDVDPETVRGVGNGLVRTESINRVTPSSKLSTILWLIGSAPPMRPAHQWVMLREEPIRMGTPWSAARVLQT